MKVRLAVSTAILATIAASSSVSAQSVDPQGGSWQSGWTPGTQVDEFWNNASDDGATCNIGYFVQGGFGPCSNEHPAAFPASLGWTNATYLAGGVPSASFRTVVLFGAGSYTLSFLGQVAGASPSRFMGVSSTDGSLDVNHMFGAAPETFTFTTTKDWQFFLQPSQPIGASTFYSNDETRQFAVFANSNGGDGEFAGDWLVGGEDNNCSELDVEAGCTRVSDFDFNDGFVRVSAVPEPSSYALMAAGLLVIGGATRRRRRSAAASV